MPRYKIIDKKDVKAYAEIQKLRAKGWRITFSNTSITILKKENDKRGGTFE